MGTLTMFEFTAFNESVHFDIKKSKSGIGKSQVYNLRTPNLLSTKALRRVLGTNCATLTKDLYGFQ